MSNTVNKGGRQPWAESSGHPCAQDLESWCYLEPGSLEGDALACHRERQLMLR